MRRLFFFLLAWSAATHASAQTWSSERGRPLLWQITAVDDTGESIWPYGDEDVAGDGLDTFEGDEASTDLRTVYADADAESLWLRAYVSAASTPLDVEVAYFFLDTDASDATGGDAFSTIIWPMLDADPSPGGYELAIAASLDEDLLGAWRWNAQAGEWEAVDTQPNDLRVEIEADIDPIRIGTDEHGYFQVEIDHGFSTLDASCDNNVFVRLRHDDAPRRFGDDDEEAWACRPALDAVGDPVVLRADCMNDDDCPADGECVEGECTFVYECSGDDDCPEGESCEGGACTREDGSAGAGGSGGSGGSGGGGGAAGTMTPPGNVQGGAFHCAATPHSTTRLGLVDSLWIALAILGLARSRRSRV